TIQCSGVGTGIKEISTFFDLPPVQRFNVSGGEACMHYLARKVEARETFVKPVQRKYRDVEAWR
ncbi:MAG: hypothetical protein Q7S99_06425, partial [Parvibaculum sp.]|nr:hypothetical protein [Parvibaculum sp.]